MKPEIRTIAATAVRDLDAARALIEQAQSIVEETADRMARCAEYGIADGLRDALEALRDLVEEDETGDTNANLRTLSADLARMAGKIRPDGDRVEIRADGRLIASVNAGAMEVRQDGVPTVGLDFATRTAGHWPDGESWTPIGRWWSPRHGFDSW